MAARSVQPANGVRHTCAVRAVMAAAVVRTSPGQVASCSVQINNHSGDRVAGCTNLRHGHGHGRGGFDTAKNLTVDNSCECRWVDG